MTVCDITQVSVSSEVLEGELGHVGQELEFIVLYELAGASADNDVTLCVSARGPTADCPVEIQEELVTNQLMSSIFRLNFSSNCKQTTAVPFGKQIAFFLGILHLCSCFSYPLLIVVVVVVVYLLICRGLGHTVVSLTPREAGEHQLEVLLGDIELEQSPLYFDIVASDTMDITAYGSGLQRAESGECILYAFLRP